jgi:hypothetical protein
MVLQILSLGNSLMVQPEAKEDVSRWGLFPRSRVTASAGKIT